jgi:hypothetical protein
VEFYLHFHYTPLRCSYYEQRQLDLYHSVDIVIISVLRLIIIFTSNCYCFYLYIYLIVTCYGLVFCSVTVQLEVIYKSRGLEEPFETQQETKRLLSTPARPLLHVAYYGNNVAPTITT